MKSALLAACCLLTASGENLAAVVRSSSASPDRRSEVLAAEVRGLGWIAYAARSDGGDWDLFACRPDGSDLRNLTRSPEYNEFAAQFSRDGRRLMYRRLPRAEAIDGNRYGAQGELVIANADASKPRVLGDRPEFAWASWGPDGTQLAALSIKGVFLFETESLKEIRRLDRKGFYQQLTWSPDGKWLVGVANSYGTGWSIARMALESGEAGAINRVDCCTPDWFPDSLRVIFSWRPPGQSGNGGQGWTQLWRADREGKERRLVYGEDGRHVYGGHVSPDGRYVLFTGNMQEDGDPGNAGAPMGLMRLADTPIIGGASPELRALHPGAHDGPVLTLPAGWEPAWTLADLSQSESAAASPGAEPALALAHEVQPKGTLVFSARAEGGDWDLFCMRPDGSDRWAFTRTPEFNEAGPRISPDARRVLYYRLPKAEPVNMTYGTRELVIADADGRNATVLGSGFPWASWGPGSDQIACLKPAGSKPAGIRIVDVATRKILREIPHSHIAQQLVWSPDGQCFLGTANRLGEYWNIGRLNLATGQIEAVSETDRYNCTPDWAPDSRQVVYARGINPAVDKDARAELWIAGGDRKDRRMLFAEQASHIYGGCVSPDGAYCLFTRSKDDFGSEGDVSGFTLGLLRLADTPMLGDNGPQLRARFPQARFGPWLDLGPGWEPHWTAAVLKQP